MASNTPYLGLTLMSVGENVGTWGSPLNQNFSKIDIVAGELISARGSSADLSGRFQKIETEIGSSRGTFSTLNERLSYLINPDGTSRIENYTRATQTSFGVVKLTVPPSDTQEPRAVGTNDPRMLSTEQKEELTSGHVTHLHKHLLTDITDVTATKDEINRALRGTNDTVSTANLNTLTGGGVVPKSIMTVPNARYDYTGIVSLSVTPVDPDKPIVVGHNDTRVLTQPEKDGLVTGNVTALHKHNLVDGAADVTVTARQLNQLTGMGTNVTASNLDNLTSGEVTSLHHHDNIYYRKNEIDEAIATAQAHNQAERERHDKSDEAHRGRNLSLGDVNLKTVTMGDAGKGIDIRANASEDNATIKLAVRDKSGIAKFTVSADGVVHADKMVVNVQEVVQTTTMTQKAIATSDLQVNGNTILGDSSANDKLIVNALNSEFNSDITVRGNHGITIEGTGTLNGVNVVDEKTKLQTLTSEVVTARGGDSSLAVRMGNMVNPINTKIDAFIAKRDNPHKVTISQAISQDNGTDITVAQLETLSDGSNADALHTHKKYDDLFTKGKKSSVYGDFTDYADRVLASEKIIKALDTEVRNARNSEASIDARLDKIDVLLKGADDRSKLNVTNIANNLAAANLDKQDLTNFKALRNNPNKVTITQAIAEDNGTDITVLELETLTDGSSCDALHTHKKYDDHINQVKTSPIYGTHTSLQKRLEKTEQVLNDIHTEVVNARNGMGSVDDRLDEIDTVITAEKGKVAILQTTSGQHGTSITANSNLIGILRNDVDAQSIQDGKHTTAINANKASINQINTLIGRLRNDVDAGATKDGQHTTGIAANKASVDAVTGRVATLEASVNGHTTSLGSVDGRINTLNTSVTNVKNELGTTASSLQGDIASTKAAANTSIENLRKKVYAGTTGVETNVTPTVKQVIGNIAVTTSNPVITRATVFKNADLNIQIKSENNNQYLKEGVDLDYISCVMSGGVASISFKIKAGSPFLNNSQKLRIIAIG